MTISRAGHRGLSGLLGLLLLLGLLALPAAAGAAAAPDKGGSNTPKLDPAAIAAFAPNPAQAPQLGITPSAGPNGFWFGLAGVGFAANTTYQLRVVDADGDVIPFNDGTVRSNENGNLGQSLRFNNLPAGTARVSLLTTGGETVASTTFQITAGGAPAAMVSALPGEARQGFYVAFTAAGLTPGATYTRAIVAPNG